MSVPRKWTRLEQRKCLELFKIYLLELQYPYDRDGNSNEPAIKNALEKLNNSLADYDNKCLKYNIPTFDQENVDATFYDIYLETEFRLSDYMRRLKERLEKNDELLKIVYYPSSITWEDVSARVDTLLHNYTNRS